MRGNLIRSITDEIYDEGKKSMATQMYQAGISVEEIARYASEDVEVVEKWLSTDKAEGGVNFLNNNPYFRRKLEQQAEEIAEKIILTDEVEITEDMLSYFTGLSKQKIEMIANDCEHIRKCREAYAIGCLSGRIIQLYNSVKDDDIEVRENVLMKIAKSFGLNKEAINHWTENPAKWAVAEYAAHGIPIHRIQSGLELSEEEVKKWLAEYEQLKDYKPIFTLELEPMETIRQLFWKMNGRRLRWYIEEESQ